jgi:hypothetical protein
MRSRRAGEDFVRVGLVAHVPHDAVFRRVEHIVQRNGQLHRAQVGAEVTARAGHALQHVLAQLGGQPRQLRARQGPQVRGLVDVRQEVGHVVVQPVPG